MKKIVAAAAAALLLAGAAFAADISFSYTGSNYFKSSGGNLSYDSRSDCMSVTLSNATSGVCLDFDTSDGKTLTQDSYYGWLNLGIPTGNLEFTAGVWTSRYVNRVRTDAGDLDSEDFELYKPGVINGSVAKDSDNLTQGKISMVAAYTNDDALPGKLMVKLGLVKSTWNPDATAATTATGSGDVTDGDLSLASGFVGEVAYREENLINVNLAVKSHVKNNYSFALFVSPLNLEGIDLTVGGTLGMVKPWNSTAKDWGNSGTEWGADLRARYQYSDNLSLTTMHNISSGYSSSEDINTMILWDMFNVNYKMDDQVTLGCTLNAVFDNLDSDHVFTGVDLATSPYCAIKASERVTVTASMRFAVSGLNPDIDGHESLDVTVPVIFAFNY